MKTITGVTMISSPAFKNENNWTDPHNHTTDTPFYLSYTRGMVWPSTVRYASWPYFFALVIMSAGVIFPLLVMVTRLRRNLFKPLRGEAE